MQRELTATLGTVGATHVRFLFGFPFALIFLAGVLLATGLPLPRRRRLFWPWVLAGALRADRRDRADAGGHERPLVRRHHRLHQDRADPGRAVRPDLSRRSGDACRWWPRSSVATAGVVVMSLKPGATEGGIKPTLLGLVVRRDVRALGRRLSRRDPLPRAAELRAWPRPSRWRSGCSMQAALLTLYLALRDPRRAARDHARLAAVAVRRLHGRDRVAVLVPRLRARDRAPTCARSRWSKCCSRRRSRASSSSRRRPRARGARHALIVVGVAAADLGAVRQSSCARPAAPAADGTRCLPRAAPWPPAARLRRRSSGARSRRSASCALPRGISRRHCRRSW